MAAFSVQSLHVNPHANSTPNLYSASLLRLTAAPGETNPSPGAIASAPPKQSRPRSGWDASAEIAASGVRLMQVALVDESRHVPAVADRKQAERKPCRHRDHHHRIMRQAGAKAADIKGARDDRDASVKLTAEEQRDVIAQHVAQNAADTADDHAGHDDDQKRQIEIERDVAPDYSEQGEADRVEHQKNMAQPMHDARNRDGEQRRAGGHQKIERMRPPRERIVPEQDVAHRAAAERGDAAEHANADPIHAAATGSRGSRHGLNNNGDNIQSVKQHGACAPARRAWLIGSGPTSPRPPYERRLSFRSTPRCALQKRSLRGTAQRRARFARESRFDRADIPIDKLDDAALVNRRVWAGLVGRGT